MSVRARVLSLALLTGVVAVSSALAGRSDSSFTVTSSLDGNTVLPVRSHRIAYPKIDPSHGQVAEVDDYLIDGYHAWTAHSWPWCPLLRAALRCTNACVKCGGSRKESTR